jgi:hypothetical protein
MADGAKEMTQSPYPKLVFEMTLVRLTQLEPLKSLDLMVDRLEALEGEFDGTEPFDPPTGGSDPAPSTSEESPEASGAGDRSTSAAEATSEQGTSREAGPDHAESATDKQPEDQSEATDEDEESDPAPAQQTEPPPMEPRPGDTTPDPSPDEPTTIDVTGGTQADGGDLDLEQRWRRVIDVLCDELGSSGVQYEHAHPDRLDDGVIELGCEQQFYEFFKDDRHQELIERAAAQAMGGEWTVSIEPWNGDDASSETLADQREAKFKQRKADLHEAVRNHEAVAKARQLFGIDDEDVYVDVELNER